MPAGRLFLSSLALNLRTVTGDTTLTLDDYTVLCDATSVNFTITLPSAASCKYGVLNIKKIDGTAHTVTVTGVSAQTIDGQTTQVISAPYVNMLLQSDGSNWYIL